MSVEVVYAIGTADASHVKIGRTTRPDQRLGDIQRMSPVPLRFLWQTTGGASLESALHRYFRAWRTHGEWFDFGDKDVVAEISTAVELIKTRALTPAGAAPKWEPTPEHAALFARRKRKKAALDVLFKQVKEQAVIEMRDHGATVGDMSRLTGLSEELFRRLARKHGIERLREPTVGKGAKPKTAD